MNSDDDFLINHADLPVSVFSDHALAQYTVCRVESVIVVYEGHEKMYCPVKISQHPIERSFTAQPP